MSLPRLVAGMFLGLLTVLVANGAPAQDYPIKTVRIVATQAGGGGDIVSRLVAQELTRVWGRQVIIDNRSSVIANEFVAKAPPDGYTLLINSSSLWLWQFMRSDASWDAMRDFVPIIQTIKQPNILAVHPSLPVKSVKELIALAKARPGELNYATGVVGATTHLASELFNSLAGVKIVGVYYRGTAAALTGLMSGEVQVMFSNAASVTPHIKSRRLKALAVTTTQPTALAPGLPTIAASGVPGYEAETILGYFVPAGTPAALVSRLNRDIARALHQPNVKEKLFNIGMEVVGGPPEQLMAVVKMEIAKWGKVIRDAGIRAN
ncbi:MAG: tripartite tricarboxylate transporter substrate binding protein [Betaproteobacteria bacterium]|nr:tripartite tricarboxylate transporter substrate binding protein [Betaproteobacteria bacterium]